MISSIRPNIRFRLPDSRIFGEKKKTGLNLKQGTNKITTKQISEPENKSEIESETIRNHRNLHLKLPITYDINCSPQARFVK